MNIKFSKRILTLIWTATALACGIVLMIMASRFSDLPDPTKEVAGETPVSIRVGILNSPTTYFLYRNNPMGFDYEMLDQFGKSSGIKIELQTASSFSDLMALLNDGKVDMVASPVPATAEFRRNALLCGPKQTTTQVLVQRKDKDIIKDVTQLVGRHVTVEPDSKFQYRLQNLNAELGGGIVIEPLQRDTLVSEDLIEMVSKKEIDLAVVDSDIARLNIEDYPTLDVSLSLSLDQLSQWAVAPGDSLLAKKINSWVDDNSSTISRLKKKYFQSSKNPIGLHSDLSEFKVTVGIGNGISPFDKAFKQAAAKSRFDWRLIAAVAYVESRFRTDLTSWAGARGVMQVMPNSAAAMGFSAERLYEPAVCIAAGVKLMQTLDKSLEKRIPDPEKRIDFILASYNAGLGHITDAIHLAEKYGLSANEWSGGVEKAALMKSRPEYYRDPVVKNGYFRARETIDFVERVKTAYHSFSSR